jgi:cytochrome bd ubiquinol oxidase subunit II
VRERRDWMPFAMAALIFLAAFGTMAGSFWPYMIPFTVTIRDAAAPLASLQFLFYGAGLIVLPIILVYTLAVYWVFRGKVTEDTGYH